MDSFFPELFGFALDGLILFSAVVFVQLNIEQKRLDKLKDSLRGIAAGYITSCNLIAYQHGRRKETIVGFEYDYKAITDLIEFFSKIEKISDDAESVKELVYYVKTHKNILESALPIAAQIDSKAIVSWTAFLTHVNIIDSNNDNFGPPIFNSLEAMRWLE